MRLRRSRMWDSRIFRGPTTARARGLRRRALPGSRMTAFPDDLELRAGDAFGYFPGEVGRSDLVGIADDNEGGTAERRQIGTRIGAAHDRGLLADERFDACVLGHRINDGA